MRPKLTNRATWFVVVIFAIAMAWVESAVVYDLRTLVNRINPYQPNPLPIIGGLGPVELVREAATLTMLLAVGILAGRTWRIRLAYAALAFGVWDIFYYVFLRVICNWPRSLFDWDILFLLPLPWWGPVLAPMCIALLMILWGTLITQLEFESVPANREIASVVAVWTINGLGICLALYVFMADTLRVVARGEDAVRNVLPERFQWPLFLASLMLMAAPILRLLGRFVVRPRTPPATANPTYTALT